MSLSAESAGLSIADPLTYTDEPQLHEALAVLRRASPVHWCEPAGYRPFWIISRHADVLRVERDHQLFRNAPRPALINERFEKRQAAAGLALRTLVHLDAPDHQAMRRIGADWFRPAAMRALHDRMRELAARSVNRLAELGGRCDFVTDAAARYPLEVIMALLGLPASDLPLMLRLTQGVFGGSDAELQRGETLAVLREFLEYFRALTEERRRRPTDDLASAIANARIDGRLLSDEDAASYYIIIATAGHDTSSSVISGGLLALLENPEQLRHLRAHPDAMPGAVEEMARWVSPVKTFMRTAAADCEVAGTRIRRGQSVLLSYPSANRDEAAFTNPQRFDITRRDNRHLAFGTGVHYCLGAALARQETAVFLTELLARAHDLELTGTPEHTATTFVGGLKHLPVHCRIAQAQSSHQEANSGNGRGCEERAGGMLSRIRESAVPAGPLT